jgi:hypothetical protein
MGLLDPLAYEGFVNPDWDLGEVLERIQREMARRHLLFWGTGGEGYWNVEVTLEQSPADGARQVAGGIVCSAGQLCLVNYEDLTMAAQFPDVRLPQEHQKDLVFDVPAGSYTCRVLRLHVASTGDRPGPPKTDILVELTASAAMPDPWDKIPWCDSYLYDYI